MELKKSAKLYAAEQNKVGTASVRTTEATLEISFGKYENALKIPKSGKKNTE